MLIPDAFGLAAYRFSIAGDPEEMVVTLGHDVQVFTPATIANALQDAFADTVFGPFAGAGVTFVGVTVTIGSQPSGLGPYFSSISTNPPVVSTGVSELVPQNTALLVRKVTGAAGRRGRGRMYFPGTITESTTSSIGVLTGAALTVRQTALNAWHARLLSDQLDPYLLHDSPPATPDAITGFVAQAVVATQRRRLRR